MKIPAFFVEKEMPEGIPACISFGNTVYSDIRRNLCINLTGRRRMKKKTTPHPLAVVLFILYMLLLCYLLFFSETCGRTMDSGYRYNLKLFKEIRRFWYNRETLGMYIVLANLLGNVAAFAPFGFFLPMLCRAGKNIVVCVLCSALFSLTVESIQLFTRVGAFDVDDIFLNTIGGLVGFLIYYLIWRPIAKKEKENRGGSR